MKNTISVIALIVVIVVTCYCGYLAHQEQLRKKELDKKLSDNLDDQKEINKIIKEKLSKDKLSLVGVNENGNGFSFAKMPIKNGKVKNKREAKKEVQ